MKSKALLVALGTVALVLVISVNTEAQLPKRGSYSGVYSWYFPGELAVDVEKDHFMWGGLSTGAFRNDAGSGFLHGGVVVCTPNGELANGSVNSTGYCVVTDKGPGATASRGQGVRKLQVHRKPVYGRDAVDPRHRQVQGTEGPRLVSRLAIGT